MGAATSQISYTASKGGVLAMTRELGVQFARQGIRVNALSPGPVATPLLHGAVRQGPRAGRAPARARADGPVRASPTEIAAAVAFLASDDASFITASNFLVDGGLTGRLRHPAVSESERCPSSA